MSEFRDPNDPLGRDTPYDLNARRDGAGWGWAAGAVVVIILVALAFGIGRNPSNQAGTNVAANNPPLTQPSPAPSGPAGSAFSPAPMNPSGPAPMNPSGPAPMNPSGPAPTSPAQP
jgi:hypothetical protein